MPSGLTKLGFAVAAALLFAIPGLTGASIAHAEDPVTTSESSTTTTSAPSTTTTSESSTTTTSAPSTTTTSAPSTTTTSESSTTTTSAPSTTTSPAPAAGSSSSATSTASAEDGADASAGENSGKSTAGLESQLQLAPIKTNASKVDFGVVISGTTAARTLTISNGGAEDVTLDDLEVSGGSAAYFGVNGGWVVVPAGGSADVEVSVSPDGPGSLSATLTGGGGAIQVQLSASGTHIRRNGSTLDLSRAIADVTVTLDAGGLVSAKGGSEEISGLAGLRSILGGPGTDTLRGPPKPEVVWNITGINSGEVAGLAFTSIEQLIGAPDNQDTFVVLAGASVQLVDGNAGGWDTLRVAGQNVVSSPTDAHSGRLEIDGVLLRYAGLEPVDISATTVTINGSDSLPGDSDLLRVSTCDGSTCTSGNIQVQNFDPLGLTQIAELQHFTVSA